MKGTEKLEINMEKERDKGGNEKGEGIIGIYLDEKQTLFFQFLCLFSIITSPALIVMYMSTYERYYPYTHNFFLKLITKSKRSMWILCIVGINMIKVKK